MADRAAFLIPQTTIAAAGTFIGEIYRLPLGVKSLGLLAKFLYGSAGTTTKAYVQTSLDGGATWVDIACFAFTTAAASKLSSVKNNIATAAGATPTDGTLTDNTILDGVLGDRTRVKYIVAGTYTGATSLTVSMVPN